MASQTIEALIEGGKATAAPPLGPALGPLGVNIGLVVSEINKKTDSFKGMQVPVKIIVDGDTKEFEITVGTPPASSLILKEASIKKGSGNPLQDKVADLKIEQIIKISIMKKDSLLGKDTKQRVREIIGTCQSMGILVEGVPAQDTLKAIDNGKYDEKIKAEKTELSAEELKELAEEKKKLEAEMAARREEYISTGKKIISEMAGKERSAIKAKMIEEKVPTAIINELLPTEDAAAPEEKPAEGTEEKSAEEEKKEETKE